MLPCLFLALTGNVLRTGTHFAVFGGSYKSLSEIKGKREGEVRTAGWGKEEEMLPFCSHFFSPLLTIISSSVGGSVAT